MNSTAKAAPIRVLMVDVTRHASQPLMKALQGDARFHFSGTVSISREFGDAVDQTRPDVIIISAEANVSGRKSIELVRQAHAMRPSLHSMMMFDSWRDDLIVEAFRAGVSGVVRDSDPAMTIAKCVESVHGGQIWASSSHLRMVLQILAQQSVPSNSYESKSNGSALLTKRELEVVRAVAEGMTNRNIAAQLNLSEHTVKNYLFRVYDKLGISNRSELLMLSLTFNRKDESTAELRQ